MADDFLFSPFFFFGFFLATFMFYQVFSSPPLYLSHLLLVL
uniref:Uncharacterized protein n=1 Tax=Rhizophora mucronata TaxID=61149 RepID=A0A2P2NLX3_RHIMU